MTTAELAQAAKTITNRKKPEDDDPPLPDTTVAQKAIAAQAPEPVDVQKARTALLAGGPAVQPPQVAPPPSTSPNEDALYAQLRQMSAPPQQPTTPLGQVGQMLSGVARYGWMDPAKAQALEMQRQGLMAGQRQQGIQDTMNQLKMMQEERYRQQQLQETQNLRDIETQRANLAQETENRKLNQPIIRGTPQSGLFVSQGKGAGTVVSPGAAKPPTGSYSRETVLYQGKPVDALVDLREGSPTNGKTFLQTPTGLQDITGQTQHYEKPKDTGEQDAGRFDRSYQYHSGEISKIETKADEFGARLSNLRDGLNNAPNNPQAQALLIPQLVAAMAGGQGSGIRINQAELQRTEGGRSNWEAAKAWAQKWSTDPAKAGSLTPAQLKQMGQIIDMVNQKHQARQQALSDARDELVNAKDEMGHRKAFQNLRTKLQQIEAGADQQDQGQQGGLPSVGGTFNGAKVLSVTPIPAGSK